MELARLGGLWRAAVPTDRLDPTKPADSKLSRTSPPPKPPNFRAPFVGTLARIYWMLAGNGILCLTALAIAQQRRERAWTADAIFWMVVASLVIVRYLDIAQLGGTTAAGEPASLRDGYRYAGWLLLLALGVWIVAHAVARIGL
jgi:hypothetical protein